MPGPTSDTGSLAFILTGPSCMSGEELVSPPSPLLGHAACGVFLWFCKMQPCLRVLSSQHLASTCAETVSLPDGSQVWWKRVGGFVTLGLVGRG